jgi:hypothetical protein
MNNLATAQIITEGLEVYRTILSQRPCLLDQLNSIVEKDNSWYLFKNKAEDLELCLGGLEEKLNSENISLIGKVQAIDLITEKLNTMISELLATID